tara:strand:+ start:3969 stop:4118 length:150 start_codon:yes stop_codon:yes gene_type:complete
MISKIRTNPRRASRNLLKSAKALTKSLMKRKKKPRERDLRDCKSKKSIV